MNTPAKRKALFREFKACLNTVLESSKRDFNPQMPRVLLAPRLERSLGVHKLLEGYDKETGVHLFETVPKKLCECVDEGELDVSHSIRYHHTLLMITSEVATHLGLILVGTEVWVGSRDLVCRVDGQHMVHPIGAIDLVYIDSEGNVCIGDVKTTNKKGNAKLLFYKLGDKLCCKRNIGQLCILAHLLKVLHNVKVKWLFIIGLDIGNSVYQVWRIDFDEAWRYMTNSSDSDKMRGLLVPFNNTLNLLGE